MSDQRYKPGQKAERSGQYTTKLCLVEGGWRSDLGDLSTCPVSSGPVQAARVCLWY